VSLEEQVAQVDLEYSLAIDQGGTDVGGVYAWPLNTGARVMVSDDRSEANRALPATECTRLALYLLACARAADRQAAGS
jgi:hypothetical protein